MTTRNENLDLMKKAKKPGRKRLWWAEESRTDGYAKKIRSKMGRGLEAEFDVITSIIKARKVFDVLEDATGQFNKWVASELTYGCPLAGSTIRMTRRILYSRDIVEEQEAKEHSLIEYLRVAESGAFLKFKGVVEEFDIALFTDPEISTSHKLRIKNSVGVNIAHCPGGVDYTIDLDSLEAVDSKDGVQIENGGYDPFDNASTADEVVQDGREAKKPSEFVDTDLIRQAYRLHEEVKLHRIKHRRLVKNLLSESKDSEERLSELKDLLNKVSTVSCQVSQILFSFRNQVRDTVAVLYSHETQSDEQDSEGGVS